MGGPDDISELEGVRKVGNEYRDMKTPTRSFEAFMDKVEGRAPSPDKTSGLSPFDMFQKQGLLAVGPTFDDLLSQAKSAHATLGDMSSDLHNKSLKLKSHQRQMLRNKLSTANDRLHEISKTLGVPSADEKVEPSGKGGSIMERFLNLINNGQTNLMNIQNQVMALKDNEGSFNPANLLFIQAKLGHAQQEIEYASVILSKAVEGLKIMMNTNIQ